MYMHYLRKPLFKRGDAAVPVAGSLKQTCMTLDFAPLLIFSVCILLVFGIHNTNTMAFKILTRLHYFSCIGSNTKVITHLVHEAQNKHDI